MSKLVRIGTRGSELALAQAGQPMERLEASCPDVDFELVPIETKGDRAKSPGELRRFGVGVFVREIESALLGGQVDVAIHSFKDMPLGLPDGTVIAATPERADPRDALVSRDGLGLAELAEGGRVGTSSARRRAQLLRARPDLEAVDIRGNLDTRIRKVEEGEDGLAAIIVAAAGLDRSGRTGRAAEIFDVSSFVPAASQGALAVQCRVDDGATCELVSTIDHLPTRIASEAERAILAALGGSCRVPVGVLAAVEGDGFSIIASVLSLNGLDEIRAEMTGPVADADAITGRLAEALVKRGAVSLVEASKESSE